MTDKEELLKLVRKVAERSTVIGIQLQLLQVALNDLADAVRELTLKINAIDEIEKSGDKDAESGTG